MNFLLLGLAAAGAEAPARVNSLARLRSALVAALIDGGVVEDGRSHPAQGVIARHFRERARDAAADIAWVFERVEAHDQIEIVKCIGRIEDMRLISRSMLRVAQKGLESEDIRSRDAAVCAIERWKSPEALALLHGHDERVPWLAAYIAQVLDESEQGQVHHT